MESYNASDHRTAELLINDASPAAWGEQQAVIERVERLVEEGAFDEYDVTVWGREIASSGTLGGTRFHYEAIEKIEEMESWTEGEPETTLCFDRRELTFEVTDESYEIVTTPTICLAVYDDDELVGVYPREEASGIVTVHGVLDRLAAAVESAPAD